MVFVIVQPDRELAACIRQLKNISTFRHSSRSLRLKLSMKPFWTGHPGAHGRESDRADLAIERLQIRQRCAIHGSQYSISSGKYKRGKAASIHRNHDDHQTATSGVRVRSTLRESIPSRSIDSCARLRHTNSTLGLRPDESAASRRLRTDRVHPSPSHHSSLTISPRHPRNTNRFGTTAVHATRSEPAHSVHRIRDADPSLLSNPDLGPTGSWITDEDSLAEYATVSDRLALHSDHRSPRKFDMNRASGRSCNCFYSRRGLTPKPSAMSDHQAQRPPQLEGKVRTLTENSKLKRLVADLSLDRHILRRSSQKSSEASHASRAGELAQVEISNLLRHSFPEWVKLIINCGLLD